MRIPIWYWVSSGLLLLLNVAVYALAPEGGALLVWTSTLLPIAAAALGAAGVLAAVAALKTRDSARLAWSLLALGMALSACGETTYMLLDSVFGIDVESLGSTVADAFWMLAYLPYFASLAILLSGYRKSGLPMGEARRYLVILGAASAAAIALILWLLVPILRDGETDLVSKIVYVYYPAADLVLLVPAGILIAITAQFGKGLLSVPWTCIAIAFLLWAGADMVYSWLGWNGLYGEGNFIDLGWNAAYLLIGAAGLFQRSILVSD